MHRWRDEALPSGGDGSLWRWKMEVCEAQCPRTCYVALAASFALSLRLPRSSSALLLPCSWIPRVNCSPPSNSSNQHPWSVLPWAWQLYLPCALKLCVSPCCAFRTSPAPAERCKSLWVLSLLQAGRWNDGRQKGLGSIRHALLPSCSRLIWKQKHSSPRIQTGKKKENALNSQLGDVCLTAPASNPPSSLWKHQSRAVSSNDFSLQKWVLGMQISTGGNDPEMVICLFLSIHRITFPSLFQCNSWLFRCPWQTSCNS